MHIAVFGASGKVGRLVVAEALRRNHSVAAAVHVHNSLPTHPKLTVYKTDVYDAASLAAPLKSAKAIISTLGSWGTARRDILERGMQNLIPLAERQGIHRLVSLTGSAAYAPFDPPPSWLQSGSHHLLRLIAPAILHDAEHHIVQLADSQLDWTVLRAPVIRKGRLDQGGYVLHPTAPPLWATVNAQAVANALLDLTLDDRLCAHQAPHVVQNDTSRPT